MYNFNSFIKDFSKRTMENIKIIDNSPEAYKVTQVINSLFGLLIVPNERYNHRNSPNHGRESNFAKTTVYESIKNRIVALKNEKRYYSSYKDEYPVSDFIKHLRNSLAHAGNCNIHFTPTGENEIIESVIFYDSGRDLVCDLDHRHNHSCPHIPAKFCAELTIDEIRDLSKKISQMYCEVEKWDTGNNNTVNDLRNYERQVKVRRALFNRS